MYIGSHISASKGFEAMGKQALKLGANTFAFFTRNPRGGKAKEIDPADVDKLLALMEEHHFGKLVAHAPYTMNLCAAKENVRSFSMEMFQDDLKRMDYLPGNYYNFHPGSHVGQGAEQGIEMIAEALNGALFEEQTTTVLLETMAGKGSEVGRSFEELRRIIDLVDLDDKLGVCLDTCHIWDGGYDVVDHLDDVLNEFDQVIGLDRLKAIHLNDSMNPLGAHKDRHEKIGQGHLGLEAITRIINHPALKELPFILETPNDDEGCGRALKFYSSVRLDVRRIEALKQGGEVIGNRTRVKVVKNKIAPPFKEAEFDIMFGEGISMVGDILDLAASCDVVAKSGAWYAYEGNKIGQGRENAKQYLKDNPAVCDEIAEKVREHYGLKADVSATAEKEE